jgi:hypothetical protein
MNDICGSCNGSGEGMFDGSICTTCHGSGCDSGPVERDYDGEAMDRAWEGRHE